MQFGNFERNRSDLETFQIVQNDVWYAPNLSLIKKIPEIRFNIDYITLPSNDSDFVRNGMYHKFKTKDCSRDDDSDDDIIIRGDSDEGATTCTCCAMKKMRTKKDPDRLWDLAQNLHVTTRICRNQFTRHWIITTCLIYSNFSLVMMNQLYHLFVSFRKI